MEDDTKGAARRSPNYIRKTKKYVLWNAGIYPITKICKKNCSPTQNFNEIAQSAASELLQIFKHCPGLCHEYR